MDRDFEQLKHIGLTDAERARMRNTLVSYMRMHPVSVASHGRHREWPAIFTSLTTLIRKPMFASAVIGIMLLLGGGASVAAQGSLPGDFLYSMKTGVNERVRSALAVSSASQAYVDASIAEERLIEAEKLASEGRLSAEVSAELGAEFKTYADRVQAVARDPEAKGDVSVAAAANSDLESTLRAHEKILVSFESKSGVSMLLGDLNAEIKETTSVRQSHEVQTDTNVEIGAKMSAEGKMTAAANKLKEVREFIEKQEAKFGANATITIAQDMMVKAENLSAQGKANFEAGLYNEATADFTDAMRAAQEAKVFVRTGLELNISGRIDGSATTSANTTPKKTEAIATPKATVKANATTSTTLDFDLETEIR